MIEKAFPTLGERYYEQVLENGLTVRVLEKPGFAKKYAMIMTDFGSIDTAFTVDGVRYETPAGVAHYLEHKMFDLPDGNAMQQFAQYGGSNNAFTSYSVTAYYVECTEHFSENLGVLLRMISTPCYSEQSVEKERGIIAQEIKMYDDSAESVVGENLMRAMFHSDPVRVPIAGSVESIAEITAQTLTLCHKTFYDPSNMILCVMGDVDAQAVIRQAEEQTIESCGVHPVRQYGPEEQMSCPQARIEKKMEVSMPTFSIGFKCESVASGPETMRLEYIGAFAAELVAGEASALYARLYESGLIDSDFSGGFERVKNAALLEFSGDSSQPDTVLEEILREAERIGTQGVDREHFRRLKKAFIGRRLRDLDSFESTCYRLCVCFMDGAEYMEYPKIVDAITAEDVEEFIRRVIRKERASISIISPL